MEESLQQKLQRVGNPVHMLRNSAVGAYPFPIPSEFSNWRDEQEAWRNSAVLLDQSFHMTDLYVEGPDVLRLLSDLGVNSFQGFTRDKAKQFVACNYDGYVIGDAVLFGLEHDKVNLVGRPPAANWVEFHARTGGYAVSVERDERSISNPQPRKTYRFEVQGPNAVKILEHLNGGPLPAIPFFQMGEITIAGRTVRALRHGMSGAPGLEIWGPAAEGPEIKDALVRAGAGFGMLLVGSRAYSTTAVESGWLPSPLPAIYTGDRMRPYREWLKSSSFEANASLGGSFESDNIEDYYLTPWDIGYGRLVKFDHDFIGKAALEREAVRAHRKKVTLAWNDEDVIRVFASLFNRHDRYKYLDIPASQYATLPYDLVLKDGAAAGISTYPAYTSNGRKWISLALVDENVSANGTEVRVLWGESNGGSAKPLVERHVQTEIRAVVGPSPFAAVTRDTYRSGAMQG